MGESPAMRILHVVGRSHHRGAEVVAIELARELDRRGHVDTLIAVGPAHRGDQVVELPVLTNAQRHRPLTFLRAARVLRRELRSDPPEVVLAHGGSPLQVAVLALGRAGTPVVYQLIMGMPSASRGRVWHGWWRWLLRRTAGAVALTQVLADEIVDLGLRSPVWVVPNARQVERFRELDHDACAAALREIAGIGPDTALVGFVGHLVEQKRPDRAVEVLAGLRAEGRDVHLFLAGDGPLAPEVRALVDRLDLADRVTLLGHREDPEAVLGGLDVFLLTSGDEGMPGVVIEAGEILETKGAEAERADHVFRDGPGSHARDLYFVKNPLHFFNRILGHNPFGHCFVYQFGIHAARMDIHGAGIINHP